MPKENTTRAARQPSYTLFEVDGDREFWRVLPSQTRPPTRGEYRTQRARAVRLARWRRWRERAEPFTAAQLAAQRLDIDSPDDPDSIGITSEATFYIRADSTPVAIVAHSDRPIDEIMAFARKWDLCLMFCEGRPTSLMLWKGLL